MGESKVMLEVKETDNTLVEADISVHMMKIICSFKYFCSFLVDDKNRLDDNKIRVDDGL